MKLLKISLLLISAVISAQTAPKELSRDNGLKNSPAKFEQTEKPSLPQPIILLNGKETVYSTMNFINPNNIESVSVFKGEQADKRLGKPVPNGLIEIKTKNTVELLTYGDLMKEYNLNPDLHIVVNKQLIADKNSLLIDRTMIGTVQTLEESPFVEPKIPHLPGEKMVYITLKQ